jgi:hypothetical protein
MAFVTGRNISPSSDVQPGHACCCLPGKATAALEHRGLLSGFTLRWGWGWCIAREVDRAFEGHTWGGDSVDADHIMMVITDEET